MRHDAADASHAPASQGARPGAGGGSNAGMEGAPSQDTRPPPAGRGAGRGAERQADFLRQFCAGGRTALLSDLSESFPTRFLELACLDELAGPAP